MPPKRDDLVRQYFEYRRDRNDSLCLANTADSPAVNYGIEEDVNKQCRKVMTGSKVSNLRAHIRARHPKIYKVLQSRNGTYICTVRKGEGIIGTKKCGKQMGPGSNGCTNNVRTSAMPNQTRRDVIKGLLQLVTVNGRPFNIVEDSGFMLLCKPVMKAYNVHYNKRTIGSLVEQAADAIKQELARIVSKSLVSVKVDCVTKFCRCFIGLNIQTSRNGQIVVFSLPVTKLEILQTEERDIKDIILKELAKHGVSSQHIYSITADTGANVFKPSELIDENCRLSGSDEDLDQVDEDKDSSALVDEILNAHWEDDGILAMRCAAHNLQLAVLDTLKTSGNAEINRYLNILKKARAIVQELRTPQQILYLKRQNLSKPISDVQTRWSSTFSMLESLMSLKNYCTAYFKNNKFVLSEDEWTMLDELRQCLEPFYIATKKLQDENLTLTDIYKILNICYMETSSIGSAFSQELLVNFIKYREVTMENVLMLSAVYLDPRFSFELTDIQRDAAITNILHVHQQLIQTNEADEGLSSLDELVNVVCNDGESRYELFLQAKHQALKVEQSSLMSFEDEVHAFQHVPRIPCKMSVLAFWEDNKNKYSQLYDIAQIVHAVPGTQLSMTRVFSQIQYVMNEQHNGLTSKNLENVLLVRSNFKHLKDSFFFIEKKTH